MFSFPFVTFTFNKQSENNLNLRVAFESIYFNNHTIILHRYQPKIMMVKRLNKDSLPKHVRNQNIPNVYELFRI